MFSNHDVVKPMNLNRDRMYCASMELDLRTLMKYFHAKCIYSKMILQIVHENVIRFLGLYTQCTL